MLIEKAAYATTPSHVKKKYSLSNALYSQGKRDKIEHEQIPQ